MKEYAEAGVTVMSFEGYASPAEVGAYAPPGELEPALVEAEPVSLEPECTAELGSIALCASCPLIRLFGGCPKALRAPEAENILIDSTAQPLEGVLPEGTPSELFVLSADFGQMVDPDALDERGEQGQPNKPDALGGLDTFKPSEPRASNEVSEHEAYQASGGSSRGPADSKNLAERTRTASLLQEVPPSRVENQPRGRAPARKGATPSASNLTPEAPMAPKIVLPISKLPEILEPLEAPEVFEISELNEIPEVFEAAQPPEISEAFETVVLPEIPNVFEVSGPLEKPETSNKRTISDTPAAPAQPQPQLQPSTLYALATPNSPPIPTTRQQQGLKPAFTQEAPQEAQNTEEEMPQPELMRTRQIGPKESLADLLFDDSIVALSATYVVEAGPPLAMRAAQSVSPELVRRPVPVEALALQNGTVPTAQDQKATSYPTDLYNLEHNKVAGEPQAALSSRSSFALSEFLGMIALSYLRLTYLYRPGYQSSTSNS